MKIANYIAVNVTISTITAGQDQHSGLTKMNCTNNNNIIVIITYLMFRVRVNSSSFVRNQNSDFAYRSFVSTARCFHRNDSHEAISSWMNIHDTCKRPISRSGSTFLEDDNIIHSNIASGKTPLVVLVQSTEILCAPTFPKMADQVLAKMPTFQQ